MNISPEVLEVLNRSTITDNSLTLPPEQLDRDLYVKVDKVLKAAGGKWNRKAKAHLFQDDPRKVLGLAIETGKIVDPKKEFEAFYTPPRLAKLLVEEAKVGPAMTVLEPSAGEGAIALALREHWASPEIKCFEVRPESFKKIEAAFATVCCDFLQVEPIGYAFDRVVMNPPFSNGQDVDHVMHAWKFLKPGGRLVSIMSAGVKFRNDNKYKTFRSFVEEIGGRIVDLPEGSFKASGTNVNTVMVTMDKA